MKNADGIFSYIKFFKRSYFFIINVKEKLCSNNDFDSEIEDCLNILENINLSLKNYKELIFVLSENSDSLKNKKQINLIEEQINNNYLSNTQLKELLEKSRGFSFLKRKEIDKIKKSIFIHISSTIMLANKIIKTNKQEKDQSLSPEIKEITSNQKTTYIRTNSATKIASGCSVKSTAGQKLNQ